MHSTVVQKDNESDKSFSELSIYDNIDNIEQKLLKPVKNEGGKLDQSATLQLQINQLHLSNDMTDENPTLTVAKDTPQNQTQWGNLSEPYDIKKDATPKDHPSPMYRDIHQNKEYKNGNSNQGQNEAHETNDNVNTLNKIDEDIQNIEKSLYNLDIVKANPTIPAKKSIVVQEIIDSNRAPVIKAIIQPTNSKISLPKALKVNKIIFYLKIEYKPDHFIEMEVKEDDTPYTIAIKLEQYFNLKNQKDNDKLIKLIHYKVNTQIAMLFTHKSPLKKEVPIMNLSIMISDKIIPICIHENEDIKALAKQVRKKYNLSIEKEIVIANSIKHSIEERKSKKSLGSTLKIHKRDPINDTINQREPLANDKSMTDELSFSPTHDRTPLFRVNFNIKGKRNAHIDVYKDDNFHRLANEFVMTYRLGSSAINQIINILQQKYQEHVKK